MNINYIYLNKRGFEYKSSDVTEIFKMAGEEKKLTMEALYEPLNWEFTKRRNPRKLRSTSLLTDRHAGVPNTLIVETFFI